MRLDNSKALEMIEELKDSSVDLVLTDPPYNIEKKYENYDDNLEDEEYWAWMEEIIEESSRILKESGFMAIVTPENQKLDWLKLIEKSSLERLQTVYWCRSNVFGFRHSGFSQNVYPVYILGFEDSEFSSSEQVPREAEITNFNYIETPSPQSGFKEEKRVHPAQQPEKLYEKILLKCSTENDLVVDPFLGSGTSAVVSKRWNRDFIGSDISEEYLEKARKRVREVKQVISQSGIDQF